MNIKIGQKIKQLRQRDGRKQEDLATAFGVSSQAISRWESNGGYPDIELLPAIANYFNISIDELFGYSNERKEKLKNILEKAEKAINEQSDMTECIEMLRSATEEFPAEPQILIKLGYALFLHGWKKYGIRNYKRETSDYIYEDIEYNTNNIFWQEEIRIFEKVLRMDISTDEQEIVIQTLVITYSKMGYYDKAKTLALKQASLITSRECLLPKATKIEERDMYQGEAIIALLNELYNMIFYAIGSKKSISTTEAGKKITLSLVKLYESIFSDGRYGKAHLQLRDLYLYATMQETRIGKDMNKAFEYFCIAFEHNRKYKSIRCSGMYEYSAPLVSNVIFPSENFPSVPNDFWKEWMGLFSQELVTRIKADTTYSECFE